MSLSINEQDLVELQAYLTPKERTEVALLLATRPLEAPPPADFIQQLTIEDPQSDGSTGYITFALWQSQLELLNLFHTQQQVITLKSRQLGISWLACAYGLWLDLFHPVKTVLVFSKGELEAQEMVRRIKGMYERIPAPLKQQYHLPTLVVDNQTTLVWSNGSRVQSMAATKTAGSSFTATLVIADEFAKMQWAEDLYTAMKPTIDGGGKLFIISTANGRGNLFHKLWVDAVAGDNNFKVLFLPWWSRPGRTQEWYAKVSKDAVSQSALDQEYPARAEDAFNAATVEKFLPSMLLWDNCLEILPPLDPRDPVILCADAGVTNDSFALIGVSRHPDPKRHLDIAVRYVEEWKPPKNGQIDFSLPDGRVRQLCGRKSMVNVIHFCYDTYQLYDFAQRLTNDGVVICEEFGQGSPRLEADKQLFDLIVNRRIAHDGNKSLWQHIDNADRRPDPETRKLRIIKREPALKVDLCVALSMASSRCLDLPL